MSAVLETVTVGGHTFPNFLSLPQSANIGGIDVQVDLEETHESILEVTQHPVEDGADITDHSYMRPVELVMRCGWSNAQGIPNPITNFAAAQSLVKTVFNKDSTESASDFVTGVYMQLRKLQSSRELITINTSLLNYASMLITSLQVTRDQRTASVLMVTASFRQVILVAPKSTTVDQSNQADPSRTAGVQDAGSVTADIGTPAPGGTIPPSLWGLGSSLLLSKL